MLFLGGIPMPPKAKIQKEDILRTALSLVRDMGEEAVNARAIAAALGCSTQPVFSNFATMQELLEATRTAAYKIYLSFLEQEAQQGKYPQYKAFGMAYIRFAREEKALFQFLFMQNRKGKPPIPSPDFEASVQLIMRTNGIAKEKAERMHLEMWTCVHGIATMMATSFLALEEELVSQMLTDVYRGLRFRHTEEGN
jgi:AcrR family transcriptional regulator